ncbi:sodium/calcium exchanger membrane region [Novosphingobium sp. Rr 2-17]|uniref:calcium:proton antiporter n=1 Tax=Novosphingobium sp. Rr 2-17 TaxID=555793 RepID=UPI00026994FB|nr:calcium:proton antiporter [Novosphingobium sp. Rr 2-17]EIZ79848.1 sodium/calcium exchanger membrane region [Novosphingobium sp. Rr 2-17]
MNPSYLRLSFAWLTVAAVTIAPALVPAAMSPIMAGLLFAWLLGIILWAAFGVVHEAEELAESLGEPYGTLILTLSIVIIEVALISAVMLGSKDVPTLGRDTMFAVLMIVLNGVVGLGLLLGGLRHHQQSFNLQGASAYLAVTIPLAVIALILPNFTTSSASGTLSTTQSVLFSLLTIALYGLFLWLQTGRYKGFFQPVGLANAEPQDASPLPHPASSISRGRHVVLLLANILPIVILSKSLGKLLDAGIESLGAPTALGGIVIAMIVFTPEGISALRAVASNQLTRAINLCLGAATSTLGLTVPAILLIGLISGQPVVLGLSTANMVLLATTLFLNGITFTNARTTMLEGAVHLSLFAVFLVLVFSP